MKIPKEEIKNDITDWRSNIPAKSIKKVAIYFPHFIKDFVNSNYLIAFFYPSRTQLKISDSNLESDYRSIIRQSQNNFRYCQKIFLSHYSR